ncbi:MAG: insulinase family protein [Acidobacteria bacterium]|nr:insulinase family protein [Acidobacteriota bacterium]
MFSRTLSKGRALLALALVAANVLATPATRAADLALDNASQQTSNAPTAAPPSLPPGVERVTSVEGITEYRLASNGLKVLLFPDQTKQTVTVNITYLVGSRQENYGETGMAHLLEHMLFKGSTKHPNVPQELTEHGTRPNGSTFFDRTNYFETFAATDDNLRWALDLESDRMVNSFVAKKDLDSEMTVVRNEYESGENSPQGVLFKRVFAAAYDWHNYANLPIGARSDIENVPIERLQAFYKMYYQPDNAVLLIAGKIDEAKTIQLVADYFGKIPRPARKLPAIYTIEPTQDGERSVTVRRTGDTQNLFVAYHIPASAHPDDAAVGIMSSIIGDNQPSGRLYKALVETKKATSVGAAPFSLHDPGLLLFTVDLRKENSLEQARAALIETIENFSKQPPTQEEVERVRTQALSQIQLALNSSELIGLIMSETVASGDWRLLFYGRDQLKKVTPADVQRVAAKYLKPSNRTLAAFVPEAQPDRAEIPPTPDVAQLLKDYKGEAAIAAGEAFDPSPANIEARTARSALPSGLKLALLPKATRGNSVVAQLTLRYGDEKSLMNRATAASFAGEMLMRGTTKHTRQQLQDEFARLKSQVNISGGATQAFASIETIRENLPAVLRLVAEVLREPAFDAKEFEQLRQEQLASIEQQRSEPNAIGSVEFRRALNPYPKGDVRYTESFDEAVENIKATTLDDVKRFYKDFYGASNSELAVVGDFDKDAIARLAGELFGDFKSARPFQRVPTLYQDVAAANRSFPTPDKANAFFLAGFNLKLRDDNDDYPALALANYILGGGFLNSRLASRIRQKEGISYGVGSQLSAGALDEAGTFITYAIYAPQNVARLEAAFKEELARALKDGFTAEEIEAAKKGYLQSRQVARAQDSELKGKLASYLFINRTLSFDEAFDRKIAALTPGQINAAVRRHITPDKLVIIKAGDFAKAGAKQP